MNTERNFAAAVATLCEGAQTDFFEESVDED